MFYCRIEKDNLEKGGIKVNGTVHASIGAVAGFVTANTLQATPSATLALIGIGTISALLPDLDIDGKLRNRITLSHKFIKATAQMIGLLIIFYSFYEATAVDQWVSMGIGLAMFLLSSYIKQRHMLIITGIGVIVCGILLQEVWLMLMGCYILIASFVPHRSYTHSILGVVSFHFIADFFQLSTGINGAYIACMTGYISHLALDSKLLPFNRRGIKLFLPISQKEF